MKGPVALGSMVSGGQNSVVKNPPGFGILSLIERIQEFALDFQ